MHSTQYLMSRLGSRFLLVCVAATLLVGAGACRRTGGPVGEMKKQEGEKVGKIVFVGMSSGCPCTMNKVSAGWDALQAALKENGQVPVERLAVDTDREKVNTLRTERRFVALPAVYFYNPEGKLVAMLEGDLNSADIAQAIK